MGLASQSDANASVIIPVVVNGGKREDLKDYIRGNRIVMEGNLVVYKANDEYALVLRDATAKLAYCVPSQDSISGDLTFTGRVKDPQEKTDKCEEQKAAKMPGRLSTLSSETPLESQSQTLQELVSHGRAR